MAGIARELQQLWPFGVALFLTGSVGVLFHMRGVDVDDPCSKRNEMIVDMAVRWSSLAIAGVVILVAPYVLAAITGDHVVRR